jgi:nitric oxide reductase NorD protein
MALDEYLYGKISNYFRKRKNVSDELVNKTVSLNDIMPRLTILARALTGSAIEIFPFALFENYEQNLSYYFFRLLYLSTQKELNLNHFEPFDLDLNVARQRANESSTFVLEKLFAEYPISKQLFLDFEIQLQRITSNSKLIDYTWLFGKWMRDELDINISHELNNFTDQIKKATEEQAKTVLKANAVENIITVEVDKKQQEDYVMTHNFEKVETADEHSGVWRDFDGEDELEDHQEALDELNMKFVVRVDDIAHSIYHA